MRRCITPEEVKAARAARGLTQEDVAQALGVHRITISKVERGLNALSQYSMDRLIEFLGTDAGRNKLRHGVAGRTDVMMRDMVKSGIQHRVTAVMAPDGRRAVICVAIVDGADAEALMVRALQTAAACVEEG